MEEYQADDLFTENVTSELETVTKFVDSRTATGVEDRLDQADELRAVKSKQSPKWLAVIIFSTMHFSCTVSLFFLPFLRWQTWAFSIFLWIWAGFGVCGGAHRYWSHRAFKARLPLRIVLMLGCSTAGMAGYRIFNWAKDHRVHHRFTDTDADPYNSKRGFLYSHFGWFLLTRHPTVNKSTAKVDVTDNLNDSVCMFEKKYHYPLLLTFCIILPTLIPVLVWKENLMFSLAATYVRWVLQLNASFSINSLAHMYGTKPFNKNITAAQNLFVAFFAMGEGWHNYHHVFPWDYRNSELGWVDATKHLVALSQKIGWAYDLKTASPALVKRVAERYGDGSHPDALAGAPEIPEEAEMDHSLVDALPLPSKGEVKVE